eukprot:12953508-Ditylum_brightwellii.AAC.1
MSGILGMIPTSAFSFKARLSFGPHLMQLAFVYWAHPDNMSCFARTTEEVNTGDADLPLVVLDGGVAGVNVEIIPIKRKKCSSWAIPKEKVKEM